jgi:hypothetical protein
MTVGHFANQFSKDVQRPYLGVFGYSLVGFDDPCLPDESQLIRQPLRMKTFPDRMVTFL